MGEKPHPSAPANLLAPSRKDFSSLSFTGGERSANANGMGASLLQGLPGFAVEDSSPKRGEEGLSPPGWRMLSTKLGAWKACVVKAK